MEKRMIQIAPENHDVGIKESALKQAVTFLKHHTVCDRIEYHISKLSNDRDALCQEWEIALIAPQCEMESMMLVAVSVIIGSPLKTRYCHVS